MSYPARAEGLVNMIKLSQNTESIPRNLWRLLVAQTPVKNSQLTLVRKTFKGIIIIIIIIIIDRDETINHLISECSKLAQKEYKARHDWVGNVIHWEMCKKFKFDHANKWYMHNPAPVLENNTHKLLWDFDKQTDHLISARRPDLIIINKKKENLQNCRLCCPGRPQNKTERMWKER